MKQNAIELNAATKDDCRDIWKWRNHPDIRKNFFDDRPLPWEKHKDWFQSKIKDANTKIYIALQGEDKIGVIRFGTEKDFVTVSVNLNPHFFGRGLGSEIIRAGTEKILGETRASKPIIAEIKKDNIASERAFSKAGYRRAEETKEKLIYKKEIAHV